MLTIKCKNCEMILESHPTKTRSCQCENFTNIRGTNISAKNLSLVEIIYNPLEKKLPLLKKQDMDFQEKRKQRKIRKLNFEER